MWRRILLCSSLCLLCCCCLVGVAMADDVPSESAAPDEELTADQFLAELGFDTDNEDEVSLFLTWLYPLEPTSEHDMALILSGSEYSELDPVKVYIMWGYLRSELSGVEPVWAGDNTGGSSSLGSIGYIGINKNTPGVIYVMQRLPSSSGDIGSVNVLAKLDIGEYMSEQGFLTKTDLTTVESLIRDIVGNQSSAFQQQYSILSVLQDLRTSIGLSGTGSGYTVLQELGSLRQILQGTNDSILKSVRAWKFDASSNSLATIAGDGTSYGVAELLDMNFKDLDQLLLKNLGTSFDFLYSAYPGGSSVRLRSGAGVLEVLSAIGSTAFFGLNSVDYYLGPDGVQAIGSPTNLPTVVGRGFLGLNSNMENALVGGHGGSAQYSKLVFDERLNKSTETADYTDLLHAMVGIGSDLQNPLSQLQAVLAGDSDLELHRNTQENIDSVTDNFTGSGEGAVSSGDISDASGLTSGIGDAFGGNQVSTGDAFKAATDSGNFNFFSQETAVALDSVTYPAAVSLADDDAWMSDYVADENGFYTVADKSGWSLLDYLGKEG